jgi:hypothetical protein
MDRGEAGCGEAVVSGCDAPEVFQPAEDALDGVATAVERGAEAALAAPVCLRRDVSSGHLRFSAPRRVLRSRLRSDPHRRRDQRSPGRPRRTASIGVSPPRRSAVLPPERWNAIGLCVATGEVERDRLAGLVCRGVDLAGPAAARPPDGLRVLPPFPPEALRCAFASVASRNTSAGGPPAAASASKRRRQTPLIAQRRNRLCSVFGGPYSRGACRQGQPERSTWTIPLSTRRSSTRGLSHVSTGKSSATRRICASLREIQIAHPGSPPSSQGNHSESHPPASLRELYRERTRTISDTEKTRIRLSSAYHRHGANDYHAGSSGSSTIAPDQRWLARIRRRCSAR